MMDAANRVIDGLNYMKWVAAILVFGGGLIPGLGLLFAHDTDDSSGGMLLGLGFLIAGVISAWITYLVVAWMECMLDLQVHISE